MVSLIVAVATHAARAASNTLTCITLGGAHCSCQSILYSNFTSVLLVVACPAPPRQKACHIIPAGEWLAQRLCAIPQADGKSPSRLSSLAYWAPEHDVPTFQPRGRRDDQHHGPAVPTPSSNPDSYVASAELLGLGDRMQEPLLHQQTWLQKHQALDAPFVTSAATYVPHFFLVVKRY